MRRKIIILLIFILIVALGGGFLELVKTGKIKIGAVGNKTAVEQIQDRFNAAWAKRVSGDCFDDPAYDPAVDFNKDGLINITDASTLVTLASPNGRIPNQKQVAEETARKYLDDSDYPDSCVSQGPIEPDDFYGSLSGLADPNAFVVVAWSDENPGTGWDDYVFETQSDAKGNFTFDQLAKGKYVVSVAVDDGQAPISKIITIYKDQKTDVDIRSAK